MIDDLMRYMKEVEEEARRIEEEIKWLEKYLQARFMEAKELFARALSIDTRELLSPPKRKKSEDWEEV